ncbi:MAG: hypothetical protein HY092_02015 [Candidatus Kerfeldbacteria bacterium]|nr:hypothetical protein [Candidatus Kerfeldbacteria bacterium]
MKRHIRYIVGLQPELVYENLAISLSKQVGGSRSAITLGAGSRPHVSLVHFHSSLSPARLWRRIARLGRTPVEVSWNGIVFVPDRWTNPSSGWRSTSCRRSHCSSSSVMSGWRSASSRATSARRSRPGSGLI